MLSPSLNVYQLLLAFKRALPVNPLSCFSMPVLALRATFVPLRPAGGSPAKGLSSLPLLQTFRWSVTKLRL